MAVAQVGLDGDAGQGLLAAADGQRGLPVLERLAVAAGGGRGPCRAGREPADRLQVAGAARVVGEAGGVVDARALELLEHLEVELAAARGGDRLLHGAAGEVVAEGDRLALQVQQPGTQAGVERAATLEQPQLGVAGDDRGELDRLAGAVVERRDAVADRRAGRRERLRDEERVAAGERVQVGRVAARELAHGLRGQRPRLDPGDAGQRAEHAPDLGARVGPGREDQAPLREAAAEQGDDVERRVVSPVQILDHQRSGRVERGVQELLARAVLEGRGERRERGARCRGTARAGAG